MTKKPDMFTFRLSAELRKHIAELGPTAPVVRALLFLGLEAAGCDVSDIYEVAYSEILLLSHEDKGFAQSQLVNVAEQSYRRWFQRDQSGEYTAPEKAFTRAEWEALCVLYDNVCLACGQQLPLTADHVIPRSKGGSFGISNIQPLCDTCNKRKGDQTIDYRLGAARHEE